MVSGYFLIRKLFFPDTKFISVHTYPDSNRIRRPHVSGFTVGSRTSLHDIINGACAYVCLAPLVWSCYVIGSESIRIRRPHVSELLSDSKVSTLESGFKSFRIGIRIPSDACGRYPYPERKVCGFKSIRIRVDEASVTWCHKMNCIEGRTDKLWFVTISIFTFINLECCQTWCIKIYKGCTDSSLTGKQ